MSKSKKSKKDQLDLGNELLGTRLGEAHNHSQKKSGTDRFLTGIQLRPLVSGGMPGSKPLGFALGQGQAPLEVVVMKSATQPPVTAMRTAWKDRHGGRLLPQSCWSLSTAIVLPFAAHLERIPLCTDECRT